MAAVASTMFSGLAGIDNDDNGILASSHTTDKFVHARTFLLVVNDEGKVVEGMCHLMAADNTGPNIMATTRPAQFAATRASVGHL